MIKKSPYTKKEKEKKIILMFILVSENYLMRSIRSYAIIILTLSRLWVNL